MQSLLILSLQSFKTGKPYFSGLPKIGMRVKGQFAAVFSSVSLRYRVCVSADWGFATASNCLMQCFLGQISLNFLSSNDLLTYKTFSESVVRG